MVPTLRIPQGVGGEPDRERYSIHSDFSLSLQVEMCDHLSPGKWRRSRAAQLLDQLVQVGLELDPPAIWKLAELD